jgi:hypothetical protein
VIFQFDPLPCVSDGNAGVIKGSEDSLAQKDGFLDQKGYVELSYRTQSTFASNRDTVYNIFKSYLKLKSKRSDYDAADR